MPHFRNTYLTTNSQGIGTHRRVGHFEYATDYWREGPTYASANLTYDGDSDDDDGDDESDFSEFMELYRVSDDYPCNGLYTEQHDDEDLVSNHC